MTDEPPAPRRRFAAALAAIVAGSLAVGVAVTLITKGHDRTLFDEGDAFWYRSVAENLRAGHWFRDPFGGGPTAAHPPLTVVVVAAAMTFGRSVLVSRLAMSVLGAMAVGVVGLVGRRVGGDRVGLVAAALAAVTPALWINQSLIMSEAVSALVLAGVLWCALRFAERPTINAAVALGAAIGVVTLARTEAALLVVTLAVPVAATLEAVSWRRRAALGALAAVAAIVVVTPWVGWNLARFAEPVTLSTNDGQTFAGANCDDTYRRGPLFGAWSLACASDPPDRALDESQHAAALRRRGVDYATAHAGRWPVLAVARLGRTFGYWGPGDVAEQGRGEGRPPWSTWAAFVVSWLTAPLAVAGAVRIWRQGRRRLLVPFAAFAVSPVVVSVAFNGLPRHRLPLDLTMCVLAAVAVIRPDRREHASPTPSIRRG